MPKKGNKGRDPLDPSGRMGDMPAATVALRQKPGITPADILRIVRCRPNVRTLARRSKGRAAARCTHMLRIDSLSRKLKSSLNPLFVLSISSCAFAYRGSSAQRASSDESASSSTESPAKRVSVEACLKSHKHRQEKASAHQDSAMVILLQCTQKRTRVSPPFCVKCRERGGKDVNEKLPARVDSGTPNWFQL